MFGQGHSIRLFLASNSNFPYNQCTAAGRAPMPANRGVGAPPASPLRSTDNGGKNIKKMRFEAPALQVYTDMEDLLLLDPIHEVDEMGWPSAKQN